MTYRQEAFQSASETILKNLTKRGIEGHFYATSAEAVAAILTEIPEGSSIAWGGSETLAETGMLTALHKGNYNLIDRSTAGTPEEVREIYGRAFLSDYYFMSTNALTVDGELVNIDGIGNRIACLACGPRHVILLVGMNKLTPDVASAIARVQNEAAPPNAKRLRRNTPCGLTGLCGHCLSPECMCNNIVITRHSGQKNRLKLYLIAEDLGY